MVMKNEDNDALTLTGADAPMGKLLRQYWTPAIRGSALARDGAPVRVKLYGQNFVAFRTTDGAVGFVDEACPHRGVSLALGRNEENGLRCIFHGWKINASGTVVDAPCEPAARRDRFCASIRMPKYGVREAAGVVWVYLGGGEPPRFPDFEFNTLPADQVCIRRAVVPYNWLQGVEAHIDSSHVGLLHSGFLTATESKLEPATRANLAQMMNDKAPTFEMNPTAYGLQERALRNMGDGTTYARVREIVLPFYTFIPGPQDGPCGGRMSVPIDDETSAEWYIVYDPQRPLTQEVIETTFFNTSDDPDNFALNMGDASNLWGQDREAMKNGHFSGLTTNLSFEDFVVQASMGRRYDRSKEQLGSADIIIVKVRKMLTDALSTLEGGGKAPWLDGFSYSAIRAQSVVYGANQSWRDFSRDEAQASANS
jgi:phenylpropionate dioxygenase-like ring-hydroxylating dioxygenase large terminal subunit